MLWPLLISPSYLGENIANTRMEHVFFMLTLNFTVANGRQLSRRPFLPDFIFDVDHIVEIKKQKADALLSIPLGGMK